MTLTEEQRGALAHAINYIDETDLPVGELDGFDREVLRAMIDSSDPIPDVTELVELLAAGEHEQWADWAQSILDSEPGLSDGRKAAWPEMIATPYENLSEELKNKDRREVYLRSQAALDYIQQQSTEIERLRAALDKSEQILAHKTKTSTHWYEEGLQTRADLVQCKRVVEQQAARIEELERYNAWLKADREFAYDELTAKIKEMEDVHKRSGVKYAKIINELRSSVYANIPGLKKQWDEILNAPANGKIGPDAKPHCWQITEERVLAIENAISSCVLIERYTGQDLQHETAVLRAMLTEAE